MTIHRSTRILAAGSAALALALAGCSADEAKDAAADATSAAAGAAQEATSAVEDATESPIALEDGYIKEKPADKDMTAIFGTLVNHSDKDLEITGFHVEGLADGTVFEQHEVVDGVMRKIEGGHDIPAGGSHELVPGGDHLMIMNNTEDLKPGATYTLVIELSDGSEYSVEIPVRAQAAGEEDYGQDGELVNPGEHDTGDAEDMGHEDHEGHEGGDH